LPEKFPDGKNGKDLDLPPVFKESVAPAEGWRGAAGEKNKSRRGGFAAKVAGRETGRV